MTPRDRSMPPRSGGPRLGVSRVSRVRTAGGSVGQWWTPPWLATELARWAGVGAARGFPRVLDAGAGEGALTRGVLEVQPAASVTALERDTRLVGTLVGTFAGDGRVSVREMDFLATDERQRFLFGLDEIASFHVCVMNPPWEGDLPERFILRGLELAERVCAIVPLNMLCGAARSAWWAAVQPTRCRALAHRPRFAGARGGMRDVMLLEVRRRAPGRATEVRFELEVGA